MIGCPRFKALNKNKDKMITFVCSDGSFSDTITICELAKVSGMMRSYMSYTQSPESSIELPFSIKQVQDVINYIKNPFQIDNTIADYFDLIPFTDLKMETLIKPIDEMWNKHGRIVIWDTTPDFDQKQLNIEYIKKRYGFTKVIDGLDNSDMDSKTLVIRDPSWMHWRYDSDKGFIRYCDPNSRPTDKDRDIIRGWYKGFHDFAPTDEEINRIYNIDHEIIPYSIYCVGAPIVPVVKEGIKIFAMGEQIDLDTKDSEGRITPQYRLMRRKSAAYYNLAHAFPIINLLEDPLIEYIDPDPKLDTIMKYAKEQYVVFVAKRRFKDWIKHPYIVCDYDIHQINYKVVPFCDNGQYLMFGDIASNNPIVIVDGTYDEIVKYYYRQNKLILASHS